MLAMIAGATGQQRVGHIPWLFLLWYLYRRVFAANLGARCFFIYGVCVENSKTFLQTMKK